MSQENRKHNNIPYQIIVPIVLAIIFIPLIIYALDEQKKQDREMYAKWEADKAIEQKQVQNFKNSFRNLSCDEMRQKIYDEDVPLFWIGWAKETYKWKPCSEVILP